MDSICKGCGSGPVAIDAQGYCHECACRKTEAERLGLAPTPRAFKVGDVVRLEGYMFAPTDTWKGELVGHVVNITQLGSESCGTATRKGTAWWPLSALTLVKAADADSQPQSSMASTEGMAGVPSAALPVAPSEGSATDLAKQAVDLIVTTIAERTRERDEAVQRANALESQLADAKEAVIAAHKERDEAEEATRVVQRASEDYQKELKEAEARNNLMREQLDKANAAADEYTKELTQLRSQLIPPDKLPAERKRLLEMLVDQAEGNLGTARYVVLCHKFGLQCSEGNAITTFQHEIRGLARRVLSTPDRLDLTRVKECCEEWIKSDVEDCDWFNKWQPRGQTSNALANVILRELAAAEKAGGEDFTPPTNTRAELTAERIEEWANGGNEFAKLYIIQCKRVGSFRKQIATLTAELEGAKKQFDQVNITRAKDELKLQEEIKQLRAQLMPGNIEGDRKKLFEELKRFATDHGWSRSPTFDLLCRVFATSDRLDLVRKCCEDIVAVVMKEHEWCSKWGASYTTTPYQDLPHTIIRLIDAAEKAGGTTSDAALDEVPTETPHQRTLLWMQPSTQRELILEDYGNVFSLVLQQGMENNEIVRINKLSGYQISDMAKEFHNASKSFRSAEKAGGEDPKTVSCNARPDILNQEECVAFNNLPSGPTTNLIRSGFFKLRDAYDKKSSEVAALTDWKNAVEEACGVNHIDVDPDPVECLKNLIAWEVQTALDPKVSEQAAKLIVDATSTLTAELEAVKKEAEQLHVQLAGCLIAAEGHTSNPAKKGDYGWSLPYQTTLDLYRKYDALAQENERLRGQGNNKTEYARKLDGKFAITHDGKLVKMASGEEVPADEPLLLMRGRDRLALPTLQAYRKMSVSDGCNNYHFEKLDVQIALFEAYRQSHPEMMKQPSITEGKPFVPQPQRPGIADNNDGEAVGEDGRRAGPQYIAGGINLVCKYQSTPKTPEFICVGFLPIDPKCGEALK